MSDDPTRLFRLHCAEAHVLRTFLRGCHTVFETDACAANLAGSSKQACRLQEVSCPLSCICSTW